MPLLAILAAVVVLGIVGPLMRRSRRDWLATRDYHRALDTLGQLNEATPAAEQASPGQQEAEVALPAQARRARELEAEQASAGSANGLANAAEHYPVLDATDDPAATPRGGVRVLGPRNGSARANGNGTNTNGAVPAEVRRIDSEDWVAEITRASSDNHPVPARKASRRQAPMHAAPAKEVPNQQVTNYQPPEDGDLPESQDADRPKGGRRAAGRAVVVFGAEDEPPGRSKALAPAGASVMVRPAHLRRNRHRGRKAVGGTAVVVILAAAVVGGLDATGKINLMSKGAAKTPAALKSPVVIHPKKAAALPTTTLPAPTTTVPAPTTTLPAFTLVSNTNGTAMFHGGTPGAAVVITATQPCWVDAHQTNAQGPDVFTATMSAGQTETLKAPVWIRFGIASVATVTVNGKPLPSFSSPGEPYDLQVQ